MRFLTYVKLQCWRWHFSSVDILYFLLILEQIQHIYCTCSQQWTKICFTSCLTWNHGSQASVPVWLIQETENLGPIRIDLENGKILNILKQVKNSVPFKNKFLKIFFWNAQKADLGDDKADEITFFHPFLWRYKVYIWRCVQEISMSSDVCLRIRAGLMKQQFKQLFISLFTEWPWLLC